jgi:hypothetical protein
MTVVSLGSSGKIAQRAGRRTAKVPAQREPVDPAGADQGPSGGAVMSCQAGKGAEEAVMRVSVATGSRARASRLGPSGAGADSRNSARVSVRH